MSLCHFSWIQVMFQHTGQEEKLYFADTFSLRDSVFPKSWQDYEI